MSESTAGPLAIIPTRAIWDKRVTPSLLRVLAGISTHANANRICNPKQTTLAKELGITQQAISKAARHLVSLGYLRSERTKSKSGLPGYNVYRIIFDQPDTTSEVVSDTTPEVVSDTTSEVVSRGPSPRQKESRPTEAKASGEQSYKNSLIRTAYMPAVPAQAKAAKENDQEYAPDPLWVAFAEEVPAPLTRSGRQGWSKALRELREAGATPEWLHAACRAYRTRWPDMALTPHAIAKHWHVLNGAQNGTPPGSSQHQQFGDGTSADRARSQEREFAFQVAFRSWVFKLEPFELETDERTLRERFAHEHPELAPECDGALAHA